MQTNRIEDAAITLDLAVPSSMPILAMTGPADFAQALRDGMAWRMHMTHGATEQTDRTSGIFGDRDWGAHHLVRHDGPVT
ncbi:MAG: hypothetical protein ACK4GO_15300 [Gemmobacter sp.]